MKKLLILLIFITLSNIVIASYSEEINDYPGLGSSIEKYFGNNDVKLPRLDYKREITYEENVVVINLNITYNDIENTGLIVYDILPSTLINNAEDDIIDTNTEYKILDNKGIVIHYFNIFNEDINIEYLIYKENYDINKLKFLSSPVFVTGYNKDEDTAERFTQVYSPNLIVYFFILVGIIALIRVILEIKKRNDEKRNEEE